MAVKMRLRRVGAKKQPAYRIVIADARAPRDGRFIEIVGHYNPLTDPATVVFNNDRALYWLHLGAQPTDVVRSMLVRKGVWAVFEGTASPDSLIEVAPVPAPAPAPAPVVETVAVVEEVPAEEAVAEAAPAEEAATEEAPAEEALAEEGGTADVAEEAAIEEAAVANEQAEPQAE